MICCCKKKKNSKNEKDKERFSSYSCFLFVPLEALCGKQIYEIASLRFGRSLALPEIVHVATFESASPCRSEFPPQLRGSHFSLADATG